MVELSRTYLVKLRQCFLLSLVTAERVEHESTLRRRAL